MIILSSDFLWTSHTQRHTESVCAICTELILLPRPLTQGVATPDHVNVDDVLYADKKQRLPSYRGVK